MKKIISFILTLTLVLTAVGVYFVSVGAAAANTITGATLKLGASLALEFYADAEENTSMRFTTPTGASTVVKGVYDEKNSRYVYTYEGINPQCMADVITAELLSESGSVLATYENYSVKAYCDNMNKKSASELGINSVQYNALKNLLADLLVYGGEAQKYKKYNTEDLASDLGWVEENKTAFTVPTGVRGATGNADTNNKVTAVSLYMGNVNKVYFRLKLNNDKIQLTLNDKLIDRSVLEEDNGTYILYSDGIYASNFDGVYTLKMFEEGREISSVSYNLYAYVSAKHTSSIVGELVKALANYGRSAKKYVDAINMDNGFDMGDEDDDFLEEEPDNYVADVDASFDSASSISDLSWTATVNNQLTLVEDDNGGKAIKYSKPAGTQYSYYSPYLNLKQYITEEGNYDITFRFKLEGAAAGTAFSGVIRTGGETSFSLKHGNNYYADLNNEINKSNGVWYTYETTLTVLESDLNKGNYWNLGLHEIQGTVTAIYIDDVTVKKADNLIDSVNSRFDGVSDVSQLAWTTLGTITPSLVSDGNGGNALRYELQAGAGAYYTVLLDVSKYIRKSGDYKITFRYKVENSDENTKPFSGVLRTKSETSFAGKSGDNYFAALAAADKVENDTWATYTAYLFVQAEDIGTGGEWNLGIHQLQSTITAVTIDDVTITSFAFEEEKPTVVTKAETWVANEMTLISDYYYSDPLNDATLDFVLTDGNVTYTVPGFWDGANIWRVRFVCPTAGVWTYTTSCSNKGDKGLDGKSGTIACTAYSGELDIYKHGFIKETGRYFSYNDGTPFFYLGDTHWGLGSESIDMVETIAQNRVSQGFTVYQSEPIGANFNFADGISAADIYGLRTHDEKYRLIAENGLVHANASLFFSSAMMEFINKNGGFSDELIKTVHHDKSNLDIEIYDLSNEAKDQLEKITRYWVARYSAYPVMWTLAQEVDNDYYWDRDDYDGHEGWNYVNNPFKLVAEYIGAYDPYSSPLSAHMEDTGTTVASTSAFRDVKAHSWYAAQWKPTLTGGSLQAVAQDFWNNGQGKPVVNYEGRYCYLWTKHFGARAQGWMSYLSGMYGYGYGAQDTWCYTSSYSEDADSSDGVDTITKEEKQAATWLDAQTYESSYQVGYMHSFFKNTVGEWYDLIPRFDDAAYLERENGAYAVVASNQDNTKIVAYFYNFTDLTVGAKANTANGTGTGTFGNLIAGASYTYKWFDPRTNTFTSTGTFTASASGEWSAGAKTTGDMVLYIVKN